MEREWGVGGKFTEWMVEVLDDGWIVGVDWIVDWIVCVMGFVVCEIGEGGTFGSSRILARRRCSFFWSSARRQRSATQSEPKRGRSPRNDDESNKLRCGDSNTLRPGDDHATLL